MHLRFKVLLWLRLLVLYLTLFQKFSVLCDAAVDFFYYKEFPIVEIQVALMINPLFEKKVL